MTSASSAKKESAGALFAKYVSQNILGMIGVSAYVLADTFFISLAEFRKKISAGTSNIRAKLTDAMEERKCCCQRKHP